MSVEGPERFTGHKRQSPRRRAEGRVVVRRLVARGRYARWNTMRLSIRRALEAGVPGAEAFRTTLDEALLPHEVDLLQRHAFVAEDCVRDRQVRQ